MIYDYDDLEFHIMTADRFVHKDGYFEIKARPFAALSFRVSGTGVFEVSTAVFSQREQRTKAEQAVETFGVCVGMTGIILTFPVCKVAVIVLFHGLISLLALDDACVKKCRL